MKFYQDLKRYRTYSYNGWYAICRFVFALCFTLNDGIVPKQWTFSNKHRHRYQQAALLARKTKVFDAYYLYTYGIDLCLLANKVNFMLNRSKNLKSEIEDTYQNLPIQSELDLKLRATEMIEITGKKAGAWLKTCSIKWF